MRPNEMKLYEEVMLLALRDEEGTTASGAWYQQAVAGALLAELLLEGHLRATGAGKKRTLEVTGTEATGDPLLDGVVDKIAAARRPATAQTWVGRIAGTRDLAHDAVTRLCETGVLRADEGRVLFLFKRRIYPEVNPEPERRLKQRLYEAVFEDAMDVDARTVLLISVANATGLLAANFDRKALKARRQQIDRVVNGDVMGAATKEAVEAVQAAIMVAAMIPAITATVT